MITVPSLDPCTDILDTDEIMITHQNGTTDTISGANFNKRTQIISADSKTITGTPLKTGNVVRVFFTADITGSDTTTALALTYNGTSKNVKVPKDGSLVNFTAQNMGGSPVVYKYCQAYTELELLYDGTNFIIMGNPKVISNVDYSIYADGSITYYVTSYKTKRLILRVSSKTELFNLIKNSNDYYCGMLETVMIDNPATDFMLGTLIFVRLADRGMAKGLFLPMYNQNYNFLTFYAYDVNNEHFYMQDFDGNVVLQG